MTYHRVCKYSNTTVSLEEQELPTLSEHLSLPSVFNVTRSLVLCVIVDRCLSFFFWSLCCLSSFDLMIMITPLVSSHPSLKNDYFIFLY